MRNVIRVILLLVLAALIFLQTRPNTYSVKRSVVVSAPAEVAYANIADFHKWSAWSPWERLDPAMQRTFEGPESGVGAVYHWVGNSKVGAGSMTITGATAPSQVAIDLQFLKPFKSASVTTFDLAPEGAGTKVTWTMSGKNNLMSKVMCLFTSMDKMIGPDFERGLSQLKTVAEAAPADTTAPATTTGMSAK